jgi:hypothetical protein
MAVEHYRFPEGEEPQVVTSISVQCSQNDCDHCPGIFYMPEQTDDPIFCVHKCHLKPSDV